MSIVKYVVLVAIALAAWLALALIVSAHAEEHPSSARAVLVQQPRLEVGSLHSATRSQIRHDRHRRDIIGQASDPSGSSEPADIAEARRWMGARNPTGSRGPWCADFITWVLRRLGYHAGASRVARDAVLAGTPLASPAPGAIMSTASHAGFVMRVLPAGHVLLISGNHHNRVGLGIYVTHGARFARPFIEGST